MKKVAIPPVVADIIQNGIQNLDGSVFDSDEKCPYCGGVLKGHDTKRKKFASIIENSHQRNIVLNVKRSRCTKCKKLVYAKSPFYENIRLGSPIVDFCVVNLKIHTANHISKILKKMNILVSSSTIIRFKELKLDNIPNIEFHGVLFPLSLLNITENIRNDEDSDIDRLMIQMMHRRR